MNFVLLVDWSMERVAMESYTGLTTCVNGSRLMDLKFADAVSPSWTILGEAREIFNLQSSGRGGEDGTLYQSEYKQRSRM